jgi:predicted metal-dependent hydrolase
MFRAFFRTDPVPVPAEEWLEIAHEGAVYSVLLRRNAQARRYTLRVRSADKALVLTMPSRGNLSMAKDFARRHAPWIATRLARLPETVAFLPGACIPLRGVAHTLAHRPGLRGTVWTEAEGPTIVVAGAEAHVQRRVLDFLKREARRDLETAVARHAASLNVTIARVSIKDTTSRWGSCSSRGSLSFSWRLILAPPSVLDYLAAHEVAHRVEMNHSPRFWRLVKQLDPAMDAAEAWLKRHGSGLHRYGA